MKPISLITFLILTSCSNPAELSCDNDNLEKLSQVSRDFILDQTSSDSKASAITFDDFNVKKGSCRLLKRQKRIDYSVNVNGTQGSKTKTLIFDCSYTNVSKQNKEIMDTRCKLVSIR